MLATFTANLAAFLTVERMQVSKNNKPDRSTNGAPVAVLVVTYHSVAPPFGSLVMGIISGFSENPTNPDFAFSCLRISTTTFRI
jgi:hypothetical protein